MKSERFKDFIAKLMANTIFIILVIVTILLVLGMLTIVPVLLKWVGLQYDGIWALVGFSAAILILKVLRRRPFRICDKKSFIKAKKFV